MGLWSVVDAFERGEVVDDGIVLDDSDSSNALTRPSVGCRGMVVAMCSIWQLYSLQ